MIFSVGEILVDRLIKKDGSVSHVGGAPFNVAVNAFRQGAKVAFFGKVGSDKEGDFVKAEAEKYLPGGCRIATDGCKATTVAEVTLLDGERYFKFLRDDAADYNLDKNLPFDEFKELNIVNLGTLMLNKAEGKDFAEYVICECDKRKLSLAADANFRDDLFVDRKERNEAMAAVLKNADVVKFSEEELSDFTGEEKIEDGIIAFNPKKYLFVTCGKRGSVGYRKDLGFVYVSAEPVEAVVDATGAGDAFFGTVLAGLDGYVNDGAEIGKKELELIMAKANEAGGKATQKEGAV